MCSKPCACCLVSAGHFLRAALGEDVLKEKNVNKLVAEVGFFILAAYAAYAESTKQPERRKQQQQQERQRCRRRSSTSSTLSAAQRPTEEKCGSNPPTYLLTFFSPKRVPTLVSVSKGNKVSFQCPYLPHQGNFPTKLLTVKQAPRLGTNWRKE